MLSKKLTFSLTSLMVLLAFGLFCAVPSAMADHGQFGLKLSAAETMIDVSTDAGMQIASGRDRSSNRALTADTDREATLITLLLTSDRIVNLSDPAAATEDLEHRKIHLDIGDIKIDAYDAEGRALGLLDLSEAPNVVVLAHRDPTNPGREFLIRVDEQELVKAYTEARAGGPPFEIHTLLFSIPKESMEQADIDYVTKKRSPDGHAVHTNKGLGAFRVDLVDNDEGEAKYNTGVSTTPVTAGVPGVVAIQSLRERAGFIETGPFQVRVILTEEPDGGLTPEMVAVKNGTATAVAKGKTLKGAHAAVTGGRAAQLSELTPTVVSYTTMTGGTANQDALPQATGRDNKFHQYFVTVTPNGGLSEADVVVSIKQFADKVKPEAKMYTPLSDAEIVATTLADNQKPVRNARVANETLTVVATTIADTTSPKGATTAAYDARQKGTDVAGNFDSNPNLKALGAKLVIPKNGYLVLAQAKSDATDILPSDPKEKNKLTAAQKLYNISWEFVLPAPANSLSNYFRNGGTLQLVYADIPEATDSGHDDAKASAAGDDYTGYTGASSTPIAVGDVIINEIMWGSDTRALFIELRNTTDAAIGIDKLEWAIMVGSGTPPAPFTTIDKVSNIPSTGYWEVPGSQPEPIIVNGVLTDDVTPAVSMSRITGSTDGTAAASWADSARRMTKDDGITVVVNANLAGALIGTPGAENAYVKPPKPEPTKPIPPPPPAPVASPGDIMITEIMVASNSGHLPQWVELTNMSAGEVRLTGWKLVVQNDPADTEVVGSAVTLDLGDVVVGVDKKGRKQSVLVVSKTGRSSGIGTGTGDLRADRIINVQSQASPDQARYSLISEMGFTLTLVAPPSVGVRTDADVVGNLLKGWELPMSEGNRSSIIRREMGTAAEIIGTDAAGWVLADETSLIGAYVGTYYGDKDDVGTPGYDAAGALPVELSKFGAKRDPLTGQVVVTWETQSELNNAGFFIKRSQQKTGQFVPVNPTMIPGAGTTSEKQSYTYTDTTAKPNIVYYYQIEDVSLDGNRQTLTRSHRLKGHIGAAGKLTTMWGELKERE